MTLGQKGYTYLIRYSKVYNDLVKIPYKCNPYIYSSPSGSDKKNLTLNHVTVFWCLIGLQIWETSNWTSLLSQQTLRQHTSFVRSLSHWEILLKKSDRFSFAIKRTPNGSADTQPLWLFAFLNFFTFFYWLLQDAQKKLNKCELKWQKQTVLHCNLSEVGSN